MTVHIPQQPRPASLSTTYGLDDFGSGLQLAFVEVGGVRIDFEERAMFQLILWDTAGRAQEAALTPEDFEQITRTYTEVGEVVEWAAPDGTTVTLQIVFNEDDGHLEIGPSVVLGSDWDATHAVHKIFLDVCPAPIVDIEDNYLAWPQYGGRTARYPATGGTQDLGGALVTHPGHAQTLEHGAIGQGGILEAIDLGFMWFGHITTRRGLYLGVNDLEGCGKYFRKDRGATSVIMGVGFIPPNNRLGIGDDYAAPYSMILKPIAGEWWDACVHWSKAMQRREHIAFTYGQLRQRSTNQQDTNYLSPIARELTAFMSGSNGTPGTSSFSTDILDEFVAFREYHGLPQNACYYSLYDWPTRFTGYAQNPNGTLNYWPDWQGAHSSAMELMAAAHAAGERFGLYAIAWFAHPAAPEYAAHGLGDFTLRDDLQAKVMVPDFTTEWPADPDPQHTECFNHATAAARAAWMAAHAGLITLFPDAPHGLYFDNWGSFGSIDDHNLALPAASRGWGSPAPIQGKRSLVVTIKEALRSANPDSVVFAERACEFTPEYDMQSAAAVQYDAFTYDHHPTVPMRLCALGPWQRLMHFIDGTSGLYTNAWKDPNAFSIANAFHYGMSQTIGVVRGWNATISGEDPLFPAPADPQYASEMALHAFRGALYCDQRELVLRCHRGQRLRDLPGSFHRDVLADNFDFSFVADGEGAIGLAPFYGGQGVMVSAWLTREMEPDTGSSTGLDIIVMVSNWRDVDTAAPVEVGNVETFTITMSTDDYPWLAGTHEVVEIDRATGDETEMDDAVDGWSYEAEMQPRDVRFFRIKSVTPAPDLTLV